MKLKDKEIISIDNTKNGTTVDWVLGNYCNFKCSYCFPDSNTGTYRVPSFDDNLKNNILHLVNEIKSTKTDYIHFNLSGGEPTVYHDITNLMYFLQTFGSVQLITNGSRTLNWWKKNLHLVNHVNISYHSEHTSLDHTIELIKLLKGKVRLTIGIMLNPLKFDSCIKAYTTLEKMFSNYPLKLELKLLRDPINGYVINYTEEQKQIISNLKNFSFSPQPEDKKLPNSKTYADCEGEKIRLEPNLIKDLTGSFQGYSCYAHHDFLQINKKGDIGEMSCSQKFADISNIYSKDFIKRFTIPPKSATICKQKTCGCLGLFYATKKK